MKRFLKALSLPLNIAISGAGIAGLTAALFLSKRGFSVIIYEKSAELSEIGAGIQLSPNALKILNNLDLSFNGEKPKALKVYSAEPSNFITSLDFNGGFITLMRAGLQRALLEAVSKDDNIELKLGSENPVIAENQNDLSAISNRSRIFSNENSAMTPNIVIHADGIHSPAREKPVDSGLIAWRAVSDNRMTENVEMVLFSGGHVVFYPVSETKTNVVLCLKQSAEMPSFTWLPRLNYTPYPLFTQPFKGGEGAMTLIGDASHAMLPMLAQGACMAIEDGFTLAKMLDENNIEASLRAFESFRKPRVTKIARAASFNRHIYHLPQPFSLARNIGMKLMGKSFSKKYDWIYYGFRS